VFAVLLSFPRKLKAKLASFNNMAAVSSIDLFGITPCSAVRTLPKTSASIHHHHAFLSRRLPRTFAVNLNEIVISKYPSRFIIHKAGSMKGLSVETVATGAIF
jgi:hypothetical protein